MKMGSPTAGSTASRLADPYTEWVASIVTFWPTFLTANTMPFAAAGVIWPSIVRMAMDASGVATPSGPRTLTATVRAPWAIVVAVQTATIQRQVSFDLVNTRDMVSFLRTLVSVNTFVS